LPAIKLHQQQAISYAEMSTLASQNIGIERDSVIIPALDVVSVHLFTVANKTARFETGRRQNAELLAELYPNAERLVNSIADWKILIVKLFLAQFSNNFRGPNEQFLNFSLEI
jgi:uncharacterized protein (DUF4213/DUF364 family)